jgi:hypothetical protein
MASLNSYQRYLQLYVCLSASTGSYICFPYDQFIKQKIKLYLLTTQLIYPKYIPWNHNETVFPIGFVHMTGNQTPISHFHYKYSSQLTYPSDSISKGRTNSLFKVPFILYMIHSSRQHLSISCPDQRFIFSYLKDKFTREGKLFSLFHYVYSSQRTYLTDTIYTGITTFIFNIPFILRMIHWYLSQSTISISSLTD